MNPKILSSLGVLVVAGCVTAPTGPSLEAFPGRNKTWEQFQADDGACRDYAIAKAGGKSSADRANEAAVGSAAVGTAIGAAAGALIGGNAAGAGIGAGIGLITGSAVGSGSATGSYYSTQRVYDSAYYQCMYAKGNKVPTYGRRYVQSAEPVQPAYYPPPPSQPAPAANYGTTVASPPPNLTSENIPPPNAPPPPQSH
ncbi:MAG TPA: hypothetical protein VMG60_12185 [Burkholderiaceae bacterium]|nr:hypothetical protein [Burkholderiaceae bacterium]